MSCLTCCKLWTAEDAAADADEIKVDATGKGVTDEDDIVIEVKEVEQEDAATSGGAQQKDAVGGKEIPQAEAVREVPPTAEEIASAVDVEEASKEAAPSSGGSGALSPSQAADAVRRVDGDLTEGGMLLTQVMGGRKAIRRLEVESDSGVLKWEVEAVFGLKWEKVKLAEARMMCTGSLVKIGVQGRSDFFTFEACDGGEAAAVCDALVGHAKKHKTKDL